MRVDIDNFKYNVDANGDYEKLKEKYHDEALEAAAYKLMCEYADYCY